jgi:MinD superfamily P-loop ATPase
MMQVYVSAGKGGRDKVWVGHELITVFKELLEHYDSLFSDNISKGE